MNVAGFQKQSLQDYPGHVSSIVFTKGCNFRCGYCHNPELISNYGKNFMDHEEIFSYMGKSKKLLEGVVITGGEPTIQRGLVDFIRRLKDMGYKVKLDTNGSNPGIIKLLIDNKLVDYIAMDYKYPSMYYMQLVRTDIRGQVIRESRDLLMGSGLPYEFRTTVVHKMFTEDILRKIAEELDGAETLRLQGFENETVFDKRFKAYPNTGEEHLKALKPLFKNIKRVIV